MTLIRPPFMGYEYVTADVAIWQPSEDCKVYQCPTCLRAVPSQYRGDVQPSIVCEGANGHRLTWRQQ